MKIGGKLEENIEKWSMFIENKEVVQGEADKFTDDSERLCDKFTDDSERLCSIS